MYSNRVYVTDILQRIPAPQIQIAQISGRTVLDILMPQFEGVARWMLTKEPEDWHGAPTIDYQHSTRENMQNMLFEIPDYSSEMMDERLVLMGFHDHDFRTEPGRIQKSLPLDDPARVHRGNARITFPPYNKITVALVISQPFVLRDILISHGYNRDACPICLEAIEPGQLHVRLMCGHHFHSDCVPDDMTRCPVCRAPIGDLNPNRRFRY
jgi:hypothetical protein